ncbi:major histocompatibility complex class I-related gene protein-like [Ahaetulla prasina]|uniref:major histocompatibility complex class I-related gene protein-like n=1 Tax=Ahaetulla prasina TaxID=499056 RepID=UPI0026484963|nr:major histocompatibility complex class I-related gene protein-like [Ahaetulla prasina]
MPLYRVFLLLLSAVLASFLPGGLCGSPSHSLSYFYLHLPEHSQGLSQFSMRSYLDDQPIARYDGLTRKMAPLVPWMEEMEKEAFLSPEWVFRTDRKLSKRDHQAGGLHTWQAVLGCEITEDGRKGGFFRYGYDGMDFLSFDKETLTWVAADQPQARKFKKEWEDDPGWSQRNKFFLEETCIEWLQRYLSYKNKTKERIEPPVGKVTRKVVDDSLETLICQAFGFYPKEIQATWTRDGEICKQETLQRNVAPNSDSTYYVWLSIEIDSKERDRFRCRLEHEGLKEPLVLAWKEETATWWLTPRVIVPASIFGVVILFAIIFSISWWKRRRNNLYEEVAPCRDEAPAPRVLYPRPENEAEDGVQAEDEVRAPLLPNLTSAASSGLQRTRSYPGTTGLSRKEGKWHTKYRTWDGCIP